MKNFKVISILALTLLLLTGGVTSKAEAGTAYVQNNTGAIITYMQMMYNNNGNWTKKFEANLRPGNSFTMNYPSWANFVTIKAYYRNGTVYTMGFHLRGGTSILSLE